jgi:predicted dehydrogenase
MADSKRIGLAIVGSGRIGTLRARLASAHPSIDLIAVSDKDPDKAKRLAERVGARSHSNNNLDIISRPEVDAVIVSTSEHEHTEAVLHALEHGKAVLVEKPLADNSRDALSIIDSIARLGGNVRIGYSRRYHQRYMLAKEQIVAGRLGKIVGGLARLYNLRTQGYAIMERDPLATPVVDSLTYYVDLMHWFLEGNRVVEVDARGQRGVLAAKGFDADDVLWAIMTCEDGAVLDLGVCYSLPEKYPSIGHAARVELLGTEGVLMIDDDHKDQLMYTERGIPHVYLPDAEVNMVFLGSSTPGDWALGEFWGPLAAETRAWLDHLSTGRACALATAEVAKRTLEVTLAIQQSALDGKPVRLAG